MEQPDLKDLKMVIRSILTSSPGKITISQVLNEYLNYEGCNLPYKHLGFKTIFELLGNMNDVLKIPSNPNMNSLVTLIVDEKTSHLRELVINQKTKKQRPRRNNSSGRSGKNHMLRSSKFKSRDYNYNNHLTENNTSIYEYTTPRYDNSIYNSSLGYIYGSHKYDNSARGYDYVKIKSHSKTSGTVTPNLRSFIENLCNTSGSEKITINKLKTCLINHPDYNKLGTTNIEESINMLKYFIYIDKGGVHLKDSPFEIFPSKTSDKRNYTIPTSSNYLSSIVDESEEISYCEANDDDYDEMDDLSFKNLNDMNESTSKNNGTVPAQNNDKNTLISSTTKSFHNEIVSKIEHKANCDVKITPDSSNTQKDDYKKAIVDIIAGSDHPITVKEVLNIFEYDHGFTFPFQVFSCGTYMDFFRLYPDMFKLEDQCSTNSVVTLEKQIIFKSKGTIRKNIIKASIFDNDAVSDYNNLNQSKIIYELLSNKDDGQKSKDIEIDNSCQLQCEKSVNSYEMYDADTILDTMKVKMRHVLSKHKDGILCSDFMNIYSISTCCHIMRSPHPHMLSLSLS